MMRINTALCTIAALLFVGNAGCTGHPGGNETSAPDAQEPKLIQDVGGTEVLEAPLDKVPGFKVFEVKRVELPAVLETTGQVTVDDPRTATIISRVTGRVEDASISQWDSVRRGQPIVTLYSPDYMTTAAEYLQAIATSRVSVGFRHSKQSTLSAAIVAAARRNNCNAHQV
jgi:multidrug efflux pump subunit AcrA (membrane-fusion protein)